MCPISNVRTGVVSELREHPIRRFFEEGLLVSVNTDDPKMFDTDLLTEYTELAAVLDFNRADIVQLLANAVRSAWCDEAKKAELLDELNHRASR
jgi:adenosine deaminase